MAIFNDFSIHPDRLLKTSLQGTGSKRSFFDRINFVNPNSIYVKGKDSIYGTGKDFLDRYSLFEKEYQSKLVTNLDPFRSSGVDVEYLMRGGGINLGILDVESKKLLERRYKEDVLRLPNLFQEVGSPGIQLPSANKYRYAFRYGVDTQERSITSSANSS